MIRPPKLFNAIIEWLCSDHIFSDIPGDLHEEFQHNLKTRGLFRAKTLYVITVITFFRPFLLNQKTFRLMSKHSFIQFLRILRKEKYYAAFNITGLGLGMACCILIFLYASNILSYEKHLVNRDRLYLYGVNMTI